MDTKLIQFLEKLSESDKLEFTRKVRVKIYEQNQLEHKCTPVHYCSEHEVFLCGQCYLVHIRTIHQATTLHALEKFNQQGFTTSTKTNNLDIDKSNSRLYKDVSAKSRTNSSTSTKIRKDKSIEQFRALVGSLSLEQLKEFYAQMKEESK